jgi:glyoxylase-like metal-dependent hydrolase (beta-lactamase superfamily II)
MSQHSYTKGLHDLGRGHFAYLVPDGSWGWSNAGLIEDSGQTMLVDTLFDLKMTADMLKAMRSAVPASSQIGALINTHANGDHTFGNQLVEGARIIASQACAEDMKLRPPEELARWGREWPTMGIAGQFWQEVIGSRFDFEGIHLTLPTETFTGQMNLRVGNKEVQLIEVGPAHTRGDVLVYVPEDRILYTGDMLFNGGHPAIWAGPVSNWIKACDLMLSWDLEAVVPGHGPMTDKAGIREFRDYLIYIFEQSRICHANGMTFEQAADHMSMDRWAHLAEDERMYVNVFACYRELGGMQGPKPNFEQMYQLMAKKHFSKQAGHGHHDHGHGHDHKH